MDDGTAPPRRPGLRGSGRRAAVPWLVVAGVVGVAAWRVVPALAPSSLWLDDAWPTLVVRADGIGEVLRTTVTAPGFTLLLAAWLDLTGLSSLAAQALPLLFALAAAPVMFVAARRLWPEGARPLVAAAMAGLAPLATTYAARVKPYTLDVLLCAVLVALAAVAVRAGAPRAARWRLSVAAVGAVMASAAVLGMAAATVGAVTVVDGARRHGVRGGGARGGGDRWWTPAACVAVAVAAWGLAVVRPAVHPALREYWAGHHLDLADPRGLPAATWHAVDGALAAVSPLPVPVTAVLVAVGVATLVARWWRARAEAADDVGTQVLLLAVAVGPWLVSFAFALAHLAPFGGGRTDSVLVVPTALATAAALGAPVARVGRVSARMAGRAAVAAMLVLAAAALPARSTYPVEDVRTVVLRVDAARADGDVVVVLSAARWAWSLYTSAPVDLVEEPAEANGFVPVVRDDATVLLRTVGRGGLEDMRAVVAARPWRVWLVVAHERAEDLAALEAVLRDAGYRRGTAVRAEGARALPWDAIEPG